MKKAIKLLMLSILCNCAYSQKYTFKLTKNDTISEAELRMIFLAPYIDSLNRFKLNDSLPAFIYDADFDYKHFSYWGAEHHAISLRAIIFENVSNKFVLQNISIGNNDLLNRKPYSEKNDLPFASYSTKDLAVIRLNELKNEQRHKDIYDY